MYLRSVVFVFFVLSVVAVKFNSCDLSYSNTIDIKAFSYKCEENCVPVYFEVHVPEKKSLYSNVYLSGTFNGWVHADRELQLIKGEKSTYHLSVLLPEGETITYRYTVGRDQKRGFAEYGELRTLNVMDSHVRRDSISEWGEGLIRSTVWTAGKLESYGIQSIFLDKYMADFVLTAPVTPSKIDSMFERAETLWAEKGALFYPGHDRLLSRTYGNLLHQQMVIGNHTATSASECHSKVNFALPAFLREISYVEAAWEASQYDLLRNYPVVIDAIYCDMLSEEHSEQLDDLYHHRLPNLVTNPPVDIDTTAFNAYQYRQFMSFYGPDYSFLRVVQSGDLDKARWKWEHTLFDAPGPYLYNSQKTQRRRYMTKILVDAFVDKGMIGDALDVLDVLAEKTSGLDVPSETLEIWYQDVAGEEGTQHFQELLAELERDVLEGHGDPIPLSGTYLNLTDSSQFDLSSLAGKTVVFDFWATYCSPCIAEIPELSAYHEAIKEREDLIFISVSEDRISEIQTPLKQLDNIIKSKGITYPILYDDPERPISAHFPVQGYPSKFVIDKEGRLVSSVHSVWNVR